MKHTMKQLVICTVACFILGTGSAEAQKAWTLAECLDHATEHSLVIAQAKANRTDSELNLRGAQLAKLPSLSAGTSYSYNFGRNIDPTTNDFVPQNLGFNRLNLSTDILVYNGGRLRQLYQQALLQDKSNRKLQEQAILDVHLDIAVAYLTVLFETERKENAEEQRTLSQNQLYRVQKLIEVEQAPEADQYEWIAQVAQDEQTIMTSENAIQNATFQLRNLLNIDPNEDFAVDVTSVEQDVSPSEEAYEFADIYAKILTVRPEVDAFELAEQAAEKEIDIAKANYMPSLVFFAALTSNYSTLASSFEDFRDVVVPKEGVFINNEPVLFAETRNIPANSFRTPYFEQLNQNLGVGLGLQLNVPIYDRGQRKLTAQRAKNNLVLSRNANQQSLKNLELQVQQVLADLRNAREQFMAGERRLEFLQNAYDNMDQRYRVGMSNNYDLLDAQNRLNQARNELTIAKYDLIFRQKILSFYLGEDLAGE